jgi:hypothetical protein
MLRCPRCDAAFAAVGVQGSGFRVQEEVEAPAPEQQIAATPLERAKAITPTLPADLLDQLAAAMAEAPVEATPQPPPSDVSRPGTPATGTAALEIAVPENTVRPEPLPKPEPKPPEPQSIEPEIAFGPLVESPVPPPVLIEDASPPSAVASPAEPQTVIAAAGAEAGADAGSIPAADEYALAETTRPPQAVLPDRRWLPTVYALASGMIAAALFGIAPAAWDVVEYVQYYDEAADPHVARWALVLLLLGVVQAAYALYLFQLPDWTSVWVVTLFSLGLAGLYALCLGLVLISRDDGLLVGPHGLQLGDKLAGGKAALWCVAMTCVSTIIAFFAGRLSSQWQRAESLRRGAAAISSAA